jgi:hypothetical protein
MRSIAPLSVLLFLLVAGCAKSEPATAPSSSSQAPTGVRSVAFDGEGGTIRGTVTDSELVPIAQAQVALDEVETLLADEFGAFEFQNVAPGPHRLYAAAIGYEAAAKGVTVVVGETASVAFLLSALAIDTGFVTIEVNEGHICFQIGIAHPTGATPGIFVNFGNLACPNAGLIFIPFDVGPGVNAIVSEMVWQPTSGVTSRELRLENWQGGARSGAFTFQHRYGQAAGVSPVVVRYGLVEGEAFGGIADEVVSVDNALIVPPDTSRPGGPNVVFDQRATVYNSVFYGLPATEEYSALPDG